MVENIKPWRPLQVLDVRLNKGTGLVELRWCLEGAVAGQLGECELMWAGDLSKKIS